MGRLISNPSRRTTRHVDGRRELAPFPARLQEPTPLVRMACRPARLAVLLVAVCAAAAPPAAAATEGASTEYGGRPWRPHPYPRTYVSPLWGRRGELWTPAGRLTDWSDAGYSGEGRPIPLYPAHRSFSIRRFGARPTPGFGALRQGALRTG